MHQSDNTDWHENKPDAKEKGNNKYSGDGGRGRKKQPAAKEQVLVKGRGGFDMKI